MDISTLDTDELLWRTETLAAEGRDAEADLVEHLAEIDRRRVHPDKTYPSLFEYCVYRLKMSEGSAYRRIRAARTFRIFPPVLEMLRDGRLSLEALALLHNAAKAPDFAVLLMRAAGASTRRIEAMLAERETAQPQRDVIRFVGAPPPLAAVDLPKDALFRTDAEPPAHDAPPQAPDPPPETTTGTTIGNPRRRVRLAFTADHRFYVTLEKARALLRRKYPDGRLEGVLMDALKALIEKKDPVMRWAASRRRRTAAA